MTLENHVNSLDMESIRKVLELIERNQIPDGHFSDLECNLWSMVQASFDKRNNRKGIVESAEEFYFMDEYGLFHNGESAVKKFETEENRTCISFADLFDYFKYYRHENQMTYEMLLKGRQKLLAMKLYRKRNNCDIRTAKMYIDRMV